MQSLHLTIPKLIKRIRVEKSITQEELAHLAGLDRTYVSGVERGVRNITLKTLDRLLVALGVGIIEFADELVIQNEKNSK